MKPITQHRSRITQERVQLSIRARFNPIPSLTPRLLGSYLESFRLGYFRNLALTWDAMERRDYQLQAVAPRRKKSVARRGFEILTVEDSTAAREQKEVLEYFYNHLTAMNALEENETGGFGLLVRQMMDAVGKRYAVHEILWQPGSRLTAQFRFCPLWWFEGTQGRLRFLTSEFAIAGEELEPGGWLVTVGDGIMEACSIAYMFKHLPLRDWLACCEKFGMPGIVGRTQAGFQSKEWNQFVEAVEAFSQDWSAVFGTGNSVELIQPKGGGEAPFAPLVEKMDRAITTLWRGGDLGTMSSRHATGASLQLEETHILEMDDAQMIQETLTTQVSRRVLEYYFGDAPALAYLKVRTADIRDTAQSLAVDQFLLQSGVPLSVKDALERYERAAPEKGEALMKPLAVKVQEPIQGTETKGQP